MLPLRFAAPQQIQFFHQRSENKVEQIYYFGSLSFSLLVKAMKINHLKVALFKNPPKVGLLSDFLAGEEKMNKSFFLFSLFFSLRTQGSIVSD